MSSLQVQPHLKDKSFLQAARAQLDSDHFGLEKIKKRLIEYLAVVRLKELNAQREAVVRDAEAAEVEAKAALDDKKDSKSDEQQGKDQAAQTSHVPPKPLKKSVKGPILLYVYLFHLIYRCVSYVSGSALLALRERERHP